MKMLMFACRCGWQGYQDELISQPNAVGGASKRCPDCNKIFRAWPSDLPKEAVKTTEALKQLFGE